MYPKFNTVDGKGLKRMAMGFNAFKSLPSIINENMNEGLAKEEIESEALINSINLDTYEAADELGGGKQSLSAAGLEPGIFGGKRLSKSLGWLSDSDSMAIEDYTDVAEPVTRNNYMKIQRGDTGSVLAQLRSEKPKTGDALEVFSFFVPKLDQETGQYIMKEVVGTRDELAKLELAGSSVINEYGPKKYSENSLIAGTKAFVKGMHSTWPGLHSLGAGTADIAEAVTNMFKSGEFKSEYTDLNAKADYLKRELDNTIYGQTTLQSDEGMFENLNAFANVMGQASSSLAQYALTGNAVGVALRLPAALGKGLAAVSAEGSSLGMIGNGIKGAIEKSPEILPMISAGVLLNYGEAYDAARQAGIPLEDAATIGFTTGALNTFIEMKFGKNVLNRWLVGGKGSKKAAETIVRETGGDMKKLYDKGVSNNILNSIMNSVNSFTATPIIGQAAEEGAEEIMQGITKNSVEMIYDQFIAPESVEIGKGRFGTKFDKASFKSLLEEGAAGAILGAFGGFVQSRQKENRSIIPFIAAGEIEALTAGANVALSKGAITQEQYDGIMGRAKALSDLRSANNDLFARVIRYDDSRQQEISEKVLTALRDQEDFATDANKKDGTAYTPKERLEQFGKLVLGSRNFTLPEGRLDLSTTEAFEKQLRKNGKVIEADMLSSAVRDTKSNVSDLLGSAPSFNNEAERKALEVTHTMISDNIFHNRFAIALNNERMRQLRGDMNTIDAKNNGALFVIPPEINVSSFMNNLI